MSPPPFFFVNTPIKPILMSIQSVTDSVTRTRIIRYTVAQINNLPTVFFLNFAIPVVEGTLTLYH